MSSDALDLELDYRRGAFELAIRATLPAQGITALTGPSGAGKSTLLRLIAGLERPGRGTIRLGAETWCDTAAGRHVAAHARPVGLMFQDSRLFPHLSVAGNLDYGARRRGRAGGGPTRGQVVEALDLGGLLERQPGGLSGGEQRRVALGRTLLAGPKLLLLDEPLTGLDRARKQAILPYIARVHARFRQPMIYVSHDMSDIAQLADTLWVLQDGRLSHAGPADAVLADWGGLDAGSDGARLVARVTVQDAARGLTRLEAGDQPIDAPYEPGAAPGDTLRLWVRARDVAIARTRPDGISIRNILPVTITALRAEPAGHDATLTLDFAGQALKARVSRASVADLALAPGQQVFALLKTVRLEAGGL